MVATGPSKKTNLLIFFCKDFCKIATILSTCHSQPSLIPFLDPEDEGLLNENVENEVFDIDFPEGLFRVRITKYDICENLFEIDSNNLDIWEPKWYELNKKRTGEGRRSTQTPTLHTSYLYVQTPGRQWMQHTTI